MRHYRYGLVAASALVFSVAFGLAGPAMADHQRGGWQSPPSGSATPPDLESVLGGVDPQVIRDWLEGRTAGATGTHGADDENQDDDDHAYEDDDDDDRHGRGWEKRNKHREAAENRQRGRSWSGLPPGLAKRDSLPPGLAKRDRLPPGLAGGRGRGRGHD